MDSKSVLILLFILVIIQIIQLYLAIK
jgi:hypothetical protein